MPAQKLYYLFLTIFLLVLVGCATYHPQTNISKATTNASKEVTHTFYIAGGIGNMDGEQDVKTLATLQQELENAPKASTLIYTGDNISEGPQQWDKDKALLDHQISLVKNFKGKTIFVPGNNEWKSYNTERIEKVENYLKDKNLENVTLEPNNVCPIEYQEINDDLALILVDSKWFISNWSRVKNMNKKCTDIVTRRRFLEELEGYINDAQGKNIVIAMHHPIFSNGKYAGKDTFKSAITPLPIAGSIGNAVKDMGAFSPNRLNSRRYNYLRILVSALAKASDRITVVSGHEESLQYLTGGDINQIVSGSLSRKTATKLGKDKITTIGGTLGYEGHFSYGEKGFAKLEYYKDGSSKVTFITPSEEEYAFNVLPKLPVKKDYSNLPAVTIKEKEDVILKDPKATEKSGFYTFLWGDRYRKYFGKSVTAPVANLDTLYGGLKATKEGGGHQSYSIRLEDKNGREYAMRSLRKNALKFLRFKVKGVAYTEDDYDDTWTEEIISDFFTTAHPYMQLVIDPLARAADINHSKPQLFYVPKQAGLGELNDEFGDELYFIEQRPSDEQENYKGYRRTLDDQGEVKEFESTTDMLEKIKSDESYTIDQKGFIRARIFDMLIGDWDRHQDQWRWVEYEDDDGNKEFLPVPRDRDNAFPKFDGNALKVIKWFVPQSRRWQSYGPEIKDVKWLNMGGNKLDRVLLTKYDKETWVEEAKAIASLLTPAKINQAFKQLPEEVRDQTSEEIKRNLEARLEKLPSYSAEYYQYLMKQVVLHATEKDDLIEITREKDGKTTVVMKRLLSDEPNEKMFSRTFSKEETDEIWIYGLGDDDVFKVQGEGDHEIFVRLIGGYGKDTYDVTNRSRLKVYDWKHEEVEIEEVKPRMQLTDVYKTNTYHWRLLQENSNILVPNVGFRTDDGMYVGATNTYSFGGFNGDPYRQIHSIAANYFFKFGAVEAIYNGEFANIFPKWNFELNGYYTNDRFSNNFFGYGNETTNLEDDLDIDYYRVRMQKKRLSAGIAYHTLRFKALYESFKAKEVDGRLLNPTTAANNLFSAQHYVGVETSAMYDNADAKDFPSKSIMFGLVAGYKRNLSDANNAFGYLKFSTGFSHKLIPSGDLVLGTKAEVNTNFGDQYYFYHAPSLGGNNGLRGFRDERFTGGTYFYQTTDLRYRIKKYVTAVAPITIGVYGGFDYGRVWQKDEDSNIWHTSQGAGIWISGFNFLSANAGYFNSVEGNLVQVGLGFQF